MPSNNYSCTSPLDVGAGCLQSHAQFCHGGNESFTLNVPEFSVKKGEIVAVCGRVGAGKSSLIQAILGDMEKVSESACLTFALAALVVHSTSARQNCCIDIGKVAVTASCIISWRHCLYFIASSEEALCALHLISAALVPTCWDICRAPVTVK
jgi:hypothetical protein